MTTVERFEQNIDQVNSDFQAIKSKLIECGVAVPEGTRTAEYAEKVGQVYEAGKKSEYDAFWDEVQQNGTRTNYALGLCGNHWTKQNFKPKYPIKPVGSMANCFAYWNNTVFKDLIDFRECCELDTSEVTSLGAAFYASALIYAIGVLDCRKCSNADTAFQNATNLTIIEMIVSASAVRYNNTFQNCSALEEIRFEGVIGSNINFQWSTKLSKASIENIIGCLSSTTSGLTVTLSKTAVTSAFGSTTSEEWLNLVATRSDWTISTI